MDVPPAPMGQNRYAVRFEVEADSTMTVTVTDPRLNRSQPLTIGDKALLVYRQPPRSAQMLNHDAPLDPAAVRVLGSLIEKEFVTPDNYPLSLNALVAACNQTSNRDPVMSLDDRAVLRSLDDLRRRSLARGMHGSDSRVTKYQHLVREALSLNDAELAVMCVLMLRGPQTAGEIKGRTNRLYDFTDLVTGRSDARRPDRPSSCVARCAPRAPPRPEGRSLHAPALRRHSACRARA